MSLQPNAQIVIADQYLPIPAPLKVGALVFPLFPEKDRLFLVESVKLLREKLELVSGRLAKEGYHLKIANVADSFTNNELGYTSIADGDIHPNRAGYAAMGKAFTKAIWGDYRVIKPRDNGVPVTVVVNGKELAGANKPLLIQNKTYVPLRDITDAIGATTKWNALTQTATVKLSGKSVDISVGAAFLNVNGEAKPLQAPAYLHQVSKTTNTLYVPLAALTRGFCFR